MPASAPKVYLVNLAYRRVSAQQPMAPVTLEPVVDVSPATKYGELVLLLETTYRLPSDLSPFLDEIKRGMANFRANDYVLIVGDPGAVAITLAMAAQRTGGIVKVLRWDPHAGEYVEHVWDLVINRLGEAQVTQKTAAAS